jgi:membrane-bound lytic murein transglycosylase D
MMHRTFEAYGLPPDLVYLSMIESGYNPTVVSRAKAVGIWQFIRGTGRRYGLEISRYVDERRDPEKATHAAAQYLRDLYILFRSWDLALAGYNAGEGKIGRSVRRHATDNFWEIRKTSYLKRETRDYVPKYLAALTIAKNPAKYGFHNIDYQRPVASERVTVTGGLSLSALAKVCGVSKKEMQALNPELRRSLTPPGSAYVLRVPPGTGGAVLDNMVALAKASRKESRTAASGDHRVRPGQTLSSIARRYGVSTRSLARANDMNSTDILRSGRKLKIPGYSVRAKGHGRPGIHVVKRGETLGSIARRYGVTIRALARANNMRTTSVLRIGRKLSVPGGSRGGQRKSA